MDWLWGVLIIFLAFLFVDVALLLANYILNRHILKEQLLKDKEVFCLYRVITTQGQKILFYGQKYRSMNDTVQTGEVRRFFRKRYEFRKDITICGVECEVMFWVGDEPEEESLVITPDGRKLLEGCTEYKEIFSAGT